MAERGLYGLSCWNALSGAQQEELIEKGRLEIFSEPEGDACEMGAEVAIETAKDKAPGPRFYCLPCAIEYLLEMVGRDAPTTP